MRVRVPQRDCPKTDEAVCCLAPVSGLLRWNSGVVQAVGGSPASPIWRVGSGGCTDQMTLTMDKVEEKR